MYCHIVSLSIFEIIFKLYRLTYLLNESVPIQPIIPDQNLFGQRIQYLLPAPLPTQLTQNLPKQVRSKLGPGPIALHRCAMCIRCMTCFFYFLTFLICNKPIEQKLRTLRFRVLYRITKITIDHRQMGFTVQELPISMVQLFFVLAVVSFLLR